MEVQSFLRVIIQHCDDNDNDEQKQSQIQVNNDAFLSKAPD